MPDSPKQPRRFPPPWTFEEYRGLAYIVRDANRFAVAYVYFASEIGHTRQSCCSTSAELKRPGVPYSTGPLRFAKSI